MAQQPATGPLAFGGIDSFAFGFPDLPLSPLESLPAEIRLLIFDYLGYPTELFERKPQAFPSDRAAAFRRSFCFVRFDGRRSTLEALRPLPTALMRVNGNFRDQLYALLYGMSHFTFRFELGGFYG